MKFFSSKNRPVHLGPYPLERLERSSNPLIFEESFETVQNEAENPDHQIYAQVADVYLDIIDQWQEGSVAEEMAPIKADGHDLTRQMKAACYFMDASMVGACEIPDEAWLTQNYEGKKHKNVFVILVEFYKEIEENNLAHTWIKGAQFKRASLRAAEIAITVAGYIRNLGWSAKSHSSNKTDLNHSLLTLHSGLGRLEHGKVVNPFLGTAFGTALVSCDMPIKADLSLVENHSKKERDWRFYWGKDGAFPQRERNRLNQRPSHWSRYPMETIKKVSQPTTLILEDEVPRVPKRAAFFERARKGDLGERTQTERSRFALKHPFTMGMAPMLRGLVKHQDGTITKTKTQGTENPEHNAKAIKSLSYFLNSDLTGICEAKRFAWFSHDDDGKPIEIKHPHAVVMLIDQGYETMEGASGDDWISGAQSMRGYLRGAIIAGQMAELIRRLGFSARVHSNLDSQVLHIPLILFSGLGELSRIGELVLNPFVGPRFKSIVITTNIPLEYDQPIDFGLQDMCRKCLKCARECPCQAISWGDTVMFNGYEMWKPDVERCTRYRVTNPKGSACGRCMKTCPYNHEGLLIHDLFLKMAIQFPFTRKLIADLDDKVGNGRINPVKKWWYDLEWVDGKAVKPKGVNQRELDLKKNMEPDKQPIAYYFADQMPPPLHPDPLPVDRKKAIAAKELLETPLQARKRKLEHKPTPDHYLTLSSK